jgi:hypothetical protein
LDFWVIRMSYDDYVSCLKFEWGCTLEPLGWMGSYIWSLSLSGGLEALVGVG